MFGQSVYDEVERILHHFPDQLVRNGAFHRHGVPVALVEVIAGNDGRVRSPQRQGDLRIALQAQLERRPRRESADGEILPSTLNVLSSGLAPNG